MIDQLRVYTGETQVNGPTKGRRYRVVRLTNHGDYSDQTGCTREWQIATLIDAFGNKYSCDPYCLKTTKEFVDYLTDEADKISSRMARERKKLDEVKNLLDQLEGVCDE